MIVKSDDSLALVIRLTKKRQMIERVLYRGLVLHLIMLIADVAVVITTTAAKLFVLACF